MLFFASLAVASEPMDEPSLTPHSCRPTRRGFARPSTAGLSSTVVPGLPIRVWFEEGHRNSEAILPLVTETLQASWSVQVDALGFPPPVLPDDLDGPEFDVYLIGYEPFAAFVAADLPYVDTGEDDGRNATTAYMVVDRGLPERWVPSYLAHEFNHAVQYATDFTEPTLPIWEGTATAAQEWTVGEAGMWELDVPSLQESTRFPTLVGDSYAIWYEYELGWTFEYGAAFWVRFLDERHGDADGRGGARLWANAAQEGLPNEPDAVDAFVATGGEPLGILLDEFALVRFLTGEDWDERGLSDAGDWGPRYHVPADPLAGTAIAGEHRSSIGQPMITGQVFFDLDIASLGGLRPRMQLSAPSRDGLETGLMVATWSATAGSAAYHLVGEGDGADVPAIEIELGGVDRVVVAITNLGPPGWDGDDDAYVEGDQRLVISLDDLPPPPFGATEAGQSVPKLAGGGGCEHAPAGLSALLVGVAAAAARRQGRAGRSATNKRS